MDDRTAPFGHYPSSMYKHGLSRWAGAWEAKAISFSEKYGALPLYQAYTWAREGKNAKVKRFEAFLMPHSSEEGAADFTLDLSQERAYGEQLIRAGVIKKKSRWKERVSTACSIAKKCGVAAGMAPLTLPSGALGIGLRYAVQNEMNTITALRPKEMLGWDGDNMRILTANVAMTEFKIMDFIDGVSPTRPRVASWFEVLKQIQPEVIFLQEAFDVDAIVPKAKELRDEGYFVLITTKRAEVLGMTPGLLMATKFPMIEVGFMPFNHLKGWDKRAGKGVLAATVSLGEERIICLATSHMQAGYPQGMTLKEKINNKTAEFHQMRRFLSRFLSDSPAYDVFFGGDFNVSRFENDGIEDVVTCDLYPAMENGLLRPTEHHPGFKDLTVPDTSETFETYLEHELDFPPNPAYEELGEAEGTCFNTASLSYHYFIPLCVLQVAEQLGLDEKESRKLVKKHLSNRPIEDESLADSVGAIISEVAQNTYIKGNTVDHLAFEVNEHSYFSEIDYDVDVIRPAGPEGFLSDHAALLFTLYVKS